MYLPVADAHGLVDHEILNVVYPLFNIFLIHTYNGEENLKILNKEIETIISRSKGKKPLIFVIIHDENRRE